MFALPNFTDDQITSKGSESGGKPIIHDVRMDMSLRNYYYVERDQRLGPVPLSTLTEMYTTGRITTETLIWSDRGMASWQKLKEAEVFPLIMQPPAQPPPLPQEDPAGHHSSQDRGLSGTTVQHLMPLTGS